jgi:outer membrane immunogenic protein
MRKSLILAAAFAATTGAALAADLPSTKEAPTLAPAPAFSWTGFYAGATIGYGWQNDLHSVGPSNLYSTDWAYPGEINSPSVNSDGVIGGLEFGYNYQLSPALVAGLEGDVSWAGVTGSDSVGGTTDYSRVMTGSDRTDFLSTVRLRLGLTPFDRVLVFATGGLALANVDLHTALSRPGWGPFMGCAGANNCQAGSSNGMEVGWTVGGGVEWAFAGAWSAKIEYLYYNVSSSYLMVDPYFPSVFNSQQNIDGNVVRLGLNYRFGASEPVLAKY